MLSLQSHRWNELTHAYGQAGDIPPLLAQLDQLPDSAGNAQPWFTLWSALAHQGNVYSASFAAVPHGVAALAANPAEAGGVFFHFPAWVEICRARRRMAVPDDLKPAYEAALARLPILVGLASQREWDAGFTASALAAIAAAKGQHDIAEAALELESPEVAADAVEWLVNR